MMNPLTPRTLSLQIPQTTISIPEVSPTTSDRTRLPFGHITKANHRGFSAFQVVPPHLSEVMARSDATIDRLFRARSPKHFSRAIIEAARSGQVQQLEQLLQAVPPASDLQKLQYDVLALFNEMIDAQPAGASEATFQCLVDRLVVRIASGSELEYAGMRRIYLLFATYRRNEPLLAILVKALPGRSSSDREGDSHLLLSCIAMCWVGGVKTLLAQGVDPNARVVGSDQLVGTVVVPTGGGPLHLLAQQADPHRAAEISQIADLLLEAGADPRMFATGKPPVRADGVISSLDAYGPADVALECGNKALAKRLIEIELNPTQKLLAQQKVRHQEVLMAMRAAVAELKQQPDAPVGPAVTQAIAALRGMMLDDHTLMRGDSSIALVNFLNVSEGRVNALPTGAARQAWLIEFENYTRFVEMFAKHSAGAVMTLLNHQLKLPPWETSSLDLLMRTTFRSRAPDQMPRLLRYLLLRKHEAAQALMTVDGLTLDMQELCAGFYLTLKTGSNQAEREALLQLNDSIISRLRFSALIRLALEAAIVQQRPDRIGPLLRHAKHHELSLVHAPRSENSDTVAHLAADAGPKVLKPLLAGLTSQDAQALVDIPNNEGDTAWHVACRRSSGSLRVLLASCDAAQGLIRRNATGRTPASEAIVAQRQDVLAVLMEHGHNEHVAEAMADALSAARGNLSDALIVGLKSDERGLRALRHCARAVMLELARRNALVSFKVFAKHVHDLATSWNQGPNPLHAMAPVATARQLQSLQSVLGAQAVRDMAAQRDGQGKYPDELASQPERRDQLARLRGIMPTRVVDAQAAQLDRLHARIDELVQAKNSAQREALAQTFVAEAQHILRGHRVPASTNAAVHRLAWQVVYALERDSDGIGMGDHLEAHLPASELGQENLSVLAARLERLSINRASRFGPADGLAVLLARRAALEENPDSGAWATPRQVVDLAQMKVQGTRLARASVSAEPVLEQATMGVRVVLRRTPRGVKVVTIYPH